MAKQADLGKEKPARWPFDPLQPGDHEPVRMPEEASRVQKQTGAGPRKGPVKRSKK